MATMVNMTASSQRVGAVLWCISSISFAAIVVRRGLRAKSLSKSGAIAAFFVGTITMLCGLRFGVTLLAFFFSSSKLSKFKAEEKCELDDDFREGGQRDWMQVLANSATATACCIAYLYFTGWRDVCLDRQGFPIATALLGGFVGHYACCNADTWASEIGILSSSRPRLITSFQSVPRGTNGGITLLGTATSACGGAFVGLCFVLAGLVSSLECSEVSTATQWRVIPLSLLAGMLGTMMDSFLGATLQFSGYCATRRKVVSRPGATVKHISGYHVLNNNTVNFISSFLTALGVAAVSLAVF